MMQQQRGGGASVCHASSERSGVQNSSLRPGPSTVAECFVLQVNIMAMSANQGTAKTASRWPSLYSQEQIHLHDKCELGGLVVFRYWRFRQAWTRAFRLQT